MLQRMYEWLTTFKQPPPSKDAYGYTQELTRDPSGLIRIQIFDARRDSGGVLLPRSSDEKWRVLPPVGGGLDWLPVESVSAQTYLEASSPDLIGVLYEGDTLDHSTTVTDVRRMARDGQGSVLAIAYYDLAEQSPVVFFREEFLDYIEDDWQFDLEIKPIREKHLRPSYQDLIDMLDAAPNYNRPKPKL